MQLYYYPLVQIIPSLQLSYAQNPVSGKKLYNNHYIVINDNNKDTLTTSSSDKVSSNNSSQGEEEFIIQIKRPGEKLDMSTINQLLSNTGIKLDPDYGPFIVNPNEGRVVVRGFASPQAQEKVIQIPGVTLFPDLKITSDSKVGPDWGSG